MARPDNDQTSYRKLSMVGMKSFAVSMPIDIIKQLSWKKGDSLTVRRHANKIVIEKVKE